MSWLTSIKSEVREERDMHGVKTLGVVKHCGIVVAVVCKKCGELYMQHGLMSGGTYQTKMTQPRVTITAMWGSR
jgi:hypothetical protein